MTYYSLVQYAVDPRGGEAANLGVVAIGGEELAYHLSPSLFEAAALGNHSVGYLRQSLKALEANIALAKVGGKNAPSRDGLQRLISRCLTPDLAEIVQFTAPAASHAPPRRVIDHFSRQTLGFTPNRIEGGARRSAANLATRILRRALESPLIHSHELRTARVVGNLVLEGRLEQHRVASGLIAASPLLVVEAISFELDDPARVTQEVTKLAYKLSDIQAGNPSLPQTVFCLGNLANHRVQGCRLRSICCSLGAKLLTHPDAEASLTRVLQDISAQHLIGHYQFR